MQSRYLIIAVALVVVVAAVGFYVIGTGSDVAQAPSPVFSNKGPASVSITSVEEARDLASAGAQNAKVIKWSTANFPSGAGVDVNLIRKTSDSPVSYELVRKIGQNLSNSGQVTWIPGADEVGEDLYIEVVCSNPAQFNGGCTTGATPLKAF